MGAGGAAGGAGGAGGAGITGDGISSEAAALSQQDILTVTGNPQDLDAKDLAAAAAAVSRLARAGNTQAARLSQRFAEILRAKNSKYLYSQPKQKSPRYVSLKTIGDCTSYRYFYNDTRRTATMTKKANVLTFMTGSTRLVRKGGAKEQLSEAVILNKVPYVSEDDAKNLFQCDCEYLMGTSYGVCLPGTIEAEAEEIYNTLTGGE